VNTTKSIIRDVVENTSWEGLVDLTYLVTPKVNDEAIKWGIKIESVRFTNLIDLKTYYSVDKVEKNDILPFNFGGF
jgi:hypothetical protein